MKKVYLIDVSRRLLILVLLLGGYITQAVAADIFVPVKDVLSVYEGTGNANAEQLKAHIQSLLQEAVDQSDQTATISDVTIRGGGGDQTGDLAAGSYNYTFKVTSTSTITLNFERAIGTGNITPVTLFGILDHEQVVVTNAIEIKARQSVGNLNFPSNWGNYVYGTPVNDLSTKIEVLGMAGVSFNDASVYLVKDGSSILYTGNNSLDAGEYDVQLTFPPTEQFAYTPALSNCTQLAVGSYISTVKLKVKEKPITNTTFPVFLEDVGGLGKMAVNTNLNRAKNLIGNNINPSDFVSEIKVYSDANFSNEVTAGRLAPGGVYSYRVVLLPNYGKGNNVSAGVGGATINFNTSQHSYDIVNAITVEKNTLAVKLPDFVSSPIRIGDYTDNAAVATMLKRLIQDINPDMVDQSLVPQVEVTGGTVSAGMADNSQFGYKVTVQGDLTKTNLNFVTDGNVSSSNLTVNGNVCTFNNSLLFVTTLPTTHSLAYPGNYQIAYEKDMLPNAVIRRIKSDLLVRNAGVLGNETFVVRLITNDLGNKNAIAETDDSFGYKIIITKSATLQEIETPANQRINVTDKGTTIEITYSKSIAIVPRPAIDFTFGEYTVQYVKDMTPAQVADKVREYIYLANPYIAEYITNVQITNNRIRENMGTATYRVTLSADLDLLFSEVTVNGQPHSSTTFNGTVNITPRPIAQVKLYKYEFKKEGASNEMIEKAIMADLLLKNPDMKGAYISSVTLVPAIGRDLYSYSVVFNPNDNIQKIEVTNEDGGIIVPITMFGYTTATYLRSVRLTDNGQSLAEYPLPINVQLPLWERPFGQTADEYALDLINDFRLTPGADRVTVPDLNNWGVKTYLINNETSTGDVPVRIAGESYPQVSDLYGYEVVTGSNTQFSQYYTLNYTAPSSIHLTKNGNDVIAKLALRIVKAKRTLTLPTVNVTYNDINTKVALLDSVKKAVLEDPANEEFFELVTKAGVKPLKSFTVTINNIEEEGTTAVKTYTYSVAFVQKVTDNIEIRETGTKTLVVNAAPVVFTFPTDITYRYGKRKAAIEADILSQFLAANEGLLSSYSCFENPADLFKVMLTTADCTAEATETMPKNGDYGYRVDVLDPALLSNFQLDNQFGSNFHNVQNSVQIGQRKLTITLPTYLAATAEEGTAAKAVFTFGKATKDQIVQQIYDDIVALNGSKINSDYTLVVDLVTTKAQLDKQNPVIGDYNYTVNLTSADYTFVYAIEGAEVTTEPDTEVVTAVNAVKVVAPGVVVTFNEKELKGIWTIVSGAPVYDLTNLTLATDDYGFSLVSLVEDPENPTAAMTKVRWDKLFSTNKLHWALYRNDKLQFHGNTLNSVLVDSVKNNVTQGTFKLRIIDASTLKAAIGNFEIQLDTDLANLKVTPATVEVKAAKDTYTKVYGTEVTKDSDLSAKLVFATEPKLTAAKLLADKNVIDLFETILPIEANVYEADAPVGDYQIRAVEAMVKGMLTPVTGVKFAASETQATVTVTPAPLTATDATITVSVVREYGEETTDADVYVAVAGELSEAFQAEITQLLNADKVARTSWLDLSGVNKKTDVGTYELRFTSSAAAQIATLLPNFNIASATLVNAGLTVTKAPLTVRACSYSRPYGGGNPDLEIEYIGLKNNEYENLADVFSVMPKVATDARSDSRGSYDIYFTTEGEARNYTVIHENGTLSIDKIKRSIIWPEDQRNLVIPVGETVELSAYLKSEADGKPSIYDIRYELSGNDRERVILSEVSKGVYSVTGHVRTEGDNYVTITVYADGDDTYEDATPVTGTIKVIAPEGDAAKINVIVSNVTSIYDATPRAVSVKATNVETGEAIPDFSIYYEGDQFGSVPTLYPSTQDAPVDAGIYNVTVKATLGSVTYAYTAKNKMVIAPKPVVVTARSFSIKYGDAMPSYANAYDYNKNDFMNGEDFLVGQAPVVRVEAYSGKAGSYKLTPYSAQDFGRNYVITYVSGLLTVSKAALSIVADNKETVYGKDLEDLTYTATGFVNGESLKNLGFAPRISSTVTKTSDAGTYPITFADNYTSDNYEVAYTDGKYILVPASQKISWSPETTIDVDGGDVLLTASASSKLPVSFNSSNDAVAYVNQIGDNWWLTPVTSGIVTVTAMQHGNKNYFGAEPVAVTIMVDDDYLSVGNEKLVVADQIDVYPRMFTHNVTVAAPTEIKQVELLSVNGTLQKVIRKPGSVIDLSSFGSGIYLLNVTLEDGTFKSVKIIKK